MLLLSFPLVLFILQILSATFPLGKCPGLLTGWVALQNAHSILWHLSLFYNCKFLGDSVINACVLQLDYDPQEGRDPVHFVPLFASCLSLCQAQRGRSLYFY